MTTVDRKSAEKLIPAVDVFRERAEARAILVESCLFDLQEAVDGLQADAERTGLVDELGQELVQKMLADAFARPQFMYRLLIGPMELAAYLAALTPIERKHIRGVKR
jgi:hypothetical protein